MVVHRFHPGVRGARHADLREMVPQIAEGKEVDLVAGIGRLPLEPGDEWIVCPDGTIVIVNRQRSPRVIRPHGTSEDPRIDHRNHHIVPSAVKLMTA